MRQIVAFQAMTFDCQPVQVQVDPDAGEVDEATLPIALLSFESGPNLVLTIPLGREDAGNLMGAFTQAEPHRQDSGMDWEPQPAGLGEGIFWALQPNLVGVAVTPPHHEPDGAVPHWTLVFDDEDGSQVQVAVADSLCVKVIRSLAQVANGELPEPEDGAIRAQPL